MKNILGFSFHENKYRLYWLVATAFLYAIHARLFLIFFTLDTYIPLDPSWTFLSIVSLIFMPICSIISIKIFKKEQYKTIYLKLNWILILQLILLVIFKDTMSIFLICCSIASVMGFILPSILYIPGSVSKIEYRGRFVGIFCMISFSFVAFLFYVTLFIQFWVLISILSGSTFIFTILSMKILNKKENIFEIKEKIEKINKNQMLFQYLLPTGVILFIIGLLGAFTFVYYPVYISPIYVAITPPDFLPKVTDFSFALVCFFMIFGGILAGFIADRFGRRNLLLIMIILFFIGIFEVTSELLGIPLIINIIIVLCKAFCYAIAWVLLIIIPHDIFQDEKKYSAQVFAFNFISLPLGFALIVGQFLLSYGDALIYPLILTCTGILGILILFASYTKETRPSKEELEWQNKIFEFFCIKSENSICMYHHAFTQTTKISENLLAGGIAGVCALVQEMLDSDKQTKVIDQEDKKLLLEFGENITCIIISSANLNILRQKLNDITQEIEFLFKEVIPGWKGNPEVFVPIKNLIKKHFF